ncbi:hypothetical protein Fmac_011046 [Flemingia macrophylla]|uniref:Uncharacterized protein n=1 Tax=Flemingia macrophylla TaxID=520843 RepID=A0ABD1MLB1_9FABA
MSFYNYLDLVGTCLRDTPVSYWTSVLRQPDDVVPAQAGPLRGLATSPRAASSPPPTTSRTSLGSPTASSAAASSVSGFPFRVFTNSRTIEVEDVIVATGAVAKRLPFIDSDEGHDDYWNRRISACIVCDGASPIFQNKPLAKANDGGENKRAIGGLKVKFVQKHEFGYDKYSNENFFQDLPNPVLEQHYQRNSININTYTVTLINSQLSDKSDVKRPN